MGVFIGGYQPGFRFRLNSESRDAFVISGGNTTTGTSHILDSTETRVTTTDSITGSQFQIDIVIERSTPFGADPSVFLSSSNTGIATINQNGQTFFQNTGNFVISGVSESGDIFGAKTSTLNLTNISQIVTGSTNVSYQRDPLDIPKHVLVCWNSNSTQSATLKDYYTGNRPLFSNANTLSLACASGEFITQSGFESQIRGPIVNFITGSNKPIRYIVLMLDVPSRISDDNKHSVSFKLSNSLSDLGIRNGLRYELSENNFSLAQFQQNTALITHLNMGNFDACKNYIDKISSKTNTSGVLHPSSGYSSNYYLEDHNGYSSFPTFVSGRYFDALKQENPSVFIDYRTRGTSYITGGSGVAAYCGWGNNGGRGSNYSINGAIQWGGNSDWYIMTTIESFNGRRSTFQGNYIKWFQSGAFGGLNGTGYNKTPIGAITHTEEPGIGGVGRSTFMKLWERGYNFAECAWSSRSTSFFMAVGDPLVTRIPPNFV